MTTPTPRSARPLLSAASWVVQFAAWTAVFGLTAFMTLFVSSDLAAFRYAGF